jgi:hypothetical protein
MKPYSVLDRVGASDVRRSPYPHVVIENCLPPEYFDALAASYPSNGEIVEFCRANPYRKFGFDEGETRQNHRYDISAFQVSDRPLDLPDIWRQFVEYHTSDAFYREVVGILGADIQRTYPSLEKRLGKPLHDFSTGVRFRSSCDISLDCQIGINTPATTTSSARGVHTDATTELFAILLYFTMPGDDTPGGDLEIFRWRNSKRRVFVGSEADPAAAELVDTVKYRANTMVMFLNTADSLHAVTPREPSVHTRRLVNIIGEVDKSFPKGLFARPKKKDGRYLRRKANKLIGKVRAG